MREGAEALGRPRVDEPGMEATALEAYEALKRLARAMYDRWGKDEGGEPVLWVDPSYGGRGDDS
jgi:hypothetical protein